MNRTGYPTAAILVSIVVVPLTFALAMIAFFLKVKLKEWKRDIWNTWWLKFFKWLWLQLCDTSGERHHSESLKEGVNLTDSGYYMMDDEGRGAKGG